MLRPVAQGRTAGQDTGSEAMLFLAGTGCQWRYLPARYGPWGAVWQQWRRWRANGVWERAMSRLASHIRVHHGRKPAPSMVMIDAQTVKGGRAGPTFHQAGGRGGHTFGAKRRVLVEILGLPIAARVESAKPHDVSEGRKLIHEVPPNLPTVRDVLADRGYTGLRNAAARHSAQLHIKIPPPPPPGKTFSPIVPLVKVEHAFAQLGRWRRLQRCFEQTRESAQAWMEVAAVGYMLGRAQEPTSAREDCVLLPCSPMPAMTNLLHDKRTRRSHEPDQRDPNEREGEPGESGITNRGTRRVRVVEEARLTGAVEAPHRLGCEDEGE